MASSGVGRKMGRGALALTVVGAAGVLASPQADASQTLTGSCGVDNKSTAVGMTVSGDAKLSYQATVTTGANRRMARFRFVGYKSGLYYRWSSYQYRYAVSDGVSFGPQSNEVVRFGGLRNSPDAPYISQYNSPDSHNSNVDGSAPVQQLPKSPSEIPTHLTVVGNHEIWVKAIFDVPNNPDPSCWTNAVLVTK